MIKFICENTANAGGGVVMWVVLLALLGFMLIMPYFTQKKRNREFMTMLESIKVGDLVKTAGGIIGRVNKISDKGDIKTVILETGSKTEKSYMEFDMTMIYCVLKSSKVENKEEIDSEADEVKNTVETVVETEVKPQEKTEITKEEKKPVKKSTTKKTVAKKATTKKD